MTVCGRLPTDPRRKQPCLSPGSSPGLPGAASPAQGASPQTPAGRPAPSSPDPKPKLAVQPPPNLPAALTPSLHATRHSPPSQEAPSPGWLLDAPQGEAELGPTRAAPPGWVPVLPQPPWTSVLGPPAAARCHRPRWAVEAQVTPQSPPHCGSKPGGQGPAPGTERASEGRPRIPGPAPRSVSPLPRRGPGPLATALSSEGPSPHLPPPPAQGLGALPGPRGAATGAGADPWPPLHPPGVLALRPSWGSSCGRWAGTSWGSC